MVGGELKLGGLNSFEDIDLIEDFIFILGVRSKQLFLFAFFCVFGLRGISHRHPFDDHIRQLLISHKFMFFFIVNGQHMVDGPANHTIYIFVCFVVAGSNFELFWFDFLVFICKDVFFSAEIIHVLVYGFYLFPS